MHQLSHNLTGFSEPMGAILLSQFVVPWAKEDILKFSFFPRTVKEWNSLPKDIVNVTSVDSIKSKLVNNIELVLFRFLQFLIFPLFHLDFYSWCDILRLIPN